MHFTSLAKYAAFLSIIASLAQAQPGNGTWRGMRNESYPKVGMSPTVYADSARFVSVGIEGKLPQKPNVGIYSFQLNRWQLADSSSYPAIASESGKAWKDSKLLVWGGCVEYGNYGCKKNTNEGWIFDLESNTWNTVARSNAPTERTGPFTSSFKDGYIIWGGRFYDSTGKSTALSSGATYNSSSKSWTSFSSEGAPLPRFSPNVKLVGNKLFVWGGYVREGSGAYNAKYLNDGYVYDLDKGVWRTISNMGSPTGRVDSTTIVYNNKVYILGGSANYPSDHSGTHVYLHDGGVYDLDSDTWETIPESPLGSHAAAGTITTNKGIFIWGGQIVTDTPNGYSVNYFREGYQFNPQDLSWVELPVLNSPDEMVNPMMAWTGEKLVVWGWVPTFGYQATGGIFTPKSN